MNVDPKWLAEKASGGTIPRDRACVCGYNLRGLKIGANCPECGRVIPRASGASVHLPKFTTYALPVLARLARGASLMAFGMLGMAAGFLLLWFNRGAALLFDASPPTLAIMLHLLVVLPCSIMWWWGLLLVSSRADGRADAAPATPSPRDLLAGRPAWFRASLLLPQWLWIASSLMALGGLFYEDVSTAAADIVLPASVGAAALGALGLLPVCLVMRELAYHATDDYAANRFHGLAFGIPLAGVLLALFPVMHLFVGMSRTIVFMAMMTGSLLLTPPAYLFLRAIWSVGTTCRWAYANALSAAAADDRFRERAARASRARSP